MIKAPLLRRLHAATDNFMKENSIDDGTLLSGHLVELPFRTGR